MLRTAILRPSLEGASSPPPARRVLPLATLALTLVSACGEFLPNSNGAAGLYCYGNPDIGGVVCVPPGSVWDCADLPNGDKKCSHSPDGTGDWTCKEQDGKVVCVSDNPDTGGGAGWDCVSNEQGTTCTSLGSTGGGDSTMDLPQPPGGGDWDCVVDEFGVVCTGQGEQPPTTGGGDLPEPGDFRTQTPGGWGAPAAGNNPGAYRDANFDGAFPDGLTVGCQGGHLAHFDSAKAIENFLPAGGKPGVLDKDYSDPTKTSAGVLAGHVVALTLAVGFDAYDAGFGGSALALKHLVATSGDCDGMTVDQILKTANNILGGCDDPMSPSAITGCVDAINNNFVDGSKANGYLTSP